MSTKLEKEKLRLVQEKCQSLLAQMLRDEDNKYCVDCDAKGPRWASWNIGIFLCIRCAGIHRNLGVHISKVKSVNLDSWTPDQVMCLQQMGNSRARAVYEANLPDSFRRPYTDSTMEAFIRGKYEQKKYIAKEWIQPVLPKVNWDNEIEDMMKKKETKKKTTPPHSNIEIPSAIPKLKKSSGGTPPPIRASPNITPKKDHEPKSSDDLLSLDNSATSSNEDPFGSFLSASTAADLSSVVTPETKPDSKAGKSSEEEDFFNQPGPNHEASQKMTKDSIMALYSQGGGNQTSFFNNVAPNVYQQQQQFYQQQPQAYPMMQQQIPVGVTNMTQLQNTMGGLNIAGIPTIPQSTDYAQNFMPQQMGNAIPTAYMPVQQMQGFPQANGQTMSTNLWQ